MKRGRGSPNYGKHRTTHPDGYIRLWKPGHPLAMRDGYVLEHRYVLDEAGVEIPEGKQVHHRNGDKADNRIENLEVVGIGEHTSGHLRTRGFVTNQFGTWPLLSEEERIEKNRVRCREYQRRRRATERGAPKC